MCHYITLVVPSEDEAELDRALRRHGRRARAVDNPSVRKVLDAGEHQYLTYAKGCDCGTTLGAGTAEAPMDDPAEARRKSVERLQRKGWSDARIERWFGDKNRFAGDGATDDGAEKERSLWAAILGDLINARGLRRAGLLVHSYRGGVADEVFKVSRRVESARDGLEALIDAMQEDELMMVQGQ